MPNCVAPIGDHCHPHSRSVSNFLHQIIFQIHPSIHPSIYAFLFASIVLLHWKGSVYSPWCLKEKELSMPRRIAKIPADGHTKKLASHIWKIQGTAASEWLALLAMNKIKWNLLQANNMNFLKWLCGIKNDICCLVIHFANQMLSDEDIKKKNDCKWMNWREWYRGYQLNFTELCFDLARSNSLACKYSFLSTLIPSSDLIFLQAFKTEALYSSRFRRHCEGMQRLNTWSFSLHLKSCSYDR